jgi:hypothetical protein
VDAESLRMRAAFAPMPKRLLREADDETLSEYAALFVWQAKAVRVIGYDECEKYLDGQLDLSAVLPHEYSDREQKWILDSLARTAKAPARRAPKAIRAAMQDLASRLPGSYLAVMSNPEKYRGQKIRCDATIRLYEEAGNLPQALRGPALEGMFR